ncbi:MAG: hypothetical protein H6737_15095 [Alphaproteobacteria bacterium]|nr:hypothetical protein [Alphaproteobacteria bacterium]
MLTLLLGSALAADWLTLLGTEEGRKDEPVRVFGFVQPEVVGVVGGERVNGERPLFNTVNGEASTAFVIRRARLGARGSIPKTGQKVTYFILLEAGEVALTRDFPIVATDLSVTLSWIPGARVRAGQMKIPVMEEIVQSVPASLEFVSFSNTLTGLLLENRVDDAGQYVGGAYGFRDVGVQVFDGFQEGRLAGAYAVMLSNGGGVHAADPDEPKDVTVRGELAWVTDGERTSGRREEVKIGGWWLEGRRELAGETTRRMRRGAFVHVEQGVAWSLVEVAQGVGTLEAGRNPPFAGSPVVMVADGEAWGVVAQGGVRLTAPVPGSQTPLSVGLKARYDEFHRRTEDEAAHRVFRTGTLGLELDPVPAVRIQANYEIRRLAAPDGPDAAQALARTMGDRASLQVTARF